jgi:hypothetical protein
MRKLEDGELDAVSGGVGRGYNSLRRPENGDVDTGYPIDNHVISKINSAGKLINGVYSREIPSDRPNGSLLNLA